MKVEQIALGCFEYLLPEVPLISNEVGGKSLWEICRLVFVLKGATDGTSLDSYDDHNFIIAVLDIATNEENNFELCCMFDTMMRDLVKCKSVKSLFENHGLFVQLAINAFIEADVSGGCHNERVFSIANRLM
jgi:hypothetical protein